MPAVGQPGPRLISALLAGHVLTATGPTFPAAAKYYINLARLVDHAIHEYESARISLSDFRSERIFNILTRGVSSLEAAVTSTHRSLRFVAALRGVGVLASDGQPIVPKPRDFEPIQAAVAKRYERMRHAIQHMDERVSSPKFMSDDTIMLEPTEDDVRLQRVVISYAEWARHLESLDGLVRRVSRIPTNELRLGSAAEVRSQL